MRLITMMLPALVLAGLATPAWSAQPPGGPPSAGWAFNGSQLVWTSPVPVPTGDAAVEFWDGERLLGRPRPSPDMRTFSLAAPKIGGAGKLEVRAAGRRLDAREQLRPAASAPLPAPPPQPAGAVDPGTPGPFQTRTGEYALDPIRLPGYQAPVEMQAIVVAPKGAPGKRPLALFLHGRHYTCYVPGDPDNISLEWPCPANTKSVPGHRGYLQAQQLLASQGYVTVSISANGINGQDFSDQDGGAQARSSLVRQHVAKWADWAGPGRGSAPDIVKSAPVADLANVLLVGHSRGGEGVNRAAVDSLSPPPVDTGYNGPVRWSIRGTLLIGPTIFGQNPAPDVPSVTILPGCDGDVSDLQGQMFLDATRGVSRGAALHSALYIVGANHNFFNTEWTPGQSEAPSSDDFFGSDDAVCSPGTPTRLTAAQQQTAGATYIAATARLFVAGDQRVLPLLDGSGVRAPSADPARVLSHAVGGARTPLVVPDDATTASGSARMCAQVTSDTAASCVDPTEWRGSPHFTRLYGITPEPGRFAAALQWNAAGQSAAIRPGKAVSLAGSRDLAIRLIVPANTTANRFDVAITDTRGRRVKLGSVSLDGLPATERLSARWAQEVRVPLPSYGIDLRQVAALELVPRSGSGQAWLIDTYGWNNGTPDPRPVALPRVDVGALTVEEGDSGTRTHQIPVTVTGNAPGTVRLFIGDDDGRTYTTHLVTIQPGQHTIEIPMQVVGNIRWSSGSSRGVFAKAVQGTVAGGFVGGLTVLNDDPQPTVTVTPVADQVAEGGVLKWRMTLSTEADSTIVWFGGALAPTGGPELSSTDVDADWFRANTYREDPLPSRPLSTTTLQTMMLVPAGELAAESSIPTVIDTETEPAEQVRLNLSSWPPVGREIEVTGTVTDQP